MLTYAAMLPAMAQAADSPTINSDRPGIPYGMSIVPPGHLQLETGLPTFENDRINAGHSLLLSTPMYLRYGVSDYVELKLGDSDSLTTMISFSRDPADGDRHANSGTLAVLLGHRFSHQLSGYVEAGWFPGFSNADDTGLAGAGVTYLLTSRLQIDGFFIWGSTKPARTRCLVQALPFGLAGRWPAPLLSSAP